MQIQSVARALKILSLFSYEHPRLGITEISRTMELPKPTVHGLIQTMVSFEFLSQDEETRKYALGRKIYELGALFTANLKINQVGAEAAAQLAARTGLTVGLAIWDQGLVMSTFRGASTYQNLHPRQFAPRVPAYCSSMGKAILAWLSAEKLNEYLNATPLVPYTSNTLADKGCLVEDLQKTRERGYSIDREEFLIGISCMGAPIFDHTGVPVGSISISGSAEELFGKKMNQLTVDLMRTATEVSYKMGYLPRG
jgi:DNA-binding IclR family transcriptional regulator